MSCDCVVKIHRNKEQILNCVVNLQKLAFDMVLKLSVNQSDWKSKGEPKQKNVFSAVYNEDIVDHVL